MNTKIGNFKIIVKKDYGSLSAAAADIIAGQIAAKPDSVIGFATGSTPVGTYARLIEMHKSGGVDFSRVTAFNLDEYYPISPKSEQSYAYFMQKNLFAHINIKPDSTHIQNGEAADPAAECAAYETKIADCGGVDLQILGVGHNGHIGFNEPADHFAAKTFLTALDDSTIAANARFFANAEEVPKHALTMGVGTIFHARRIIMLISGADKADTAFKVLCGPITPQVPGSVLQLHPDFTIIIDEMAAAKLPL